MRFKSEIYRIDLNRPTLLVVQQQQAISLRQQGDRTELESLV